ncbi:MAG: tetratricopeptide repeat protein [candidate division Zixibacteria bacterium]|nr:tetratricopeptide repeat protein [candidate division Zixibacteria bacterium]
MSSLRGAVQKELDLPDQKYGDHKEGLAKVAFLRGRLYAMMFQYSKAIEQYERALQLFTSGDRQSLVNYYMGMAHEIWGKKELAIECYEAVKSLRGLDDDMGMDSAKRIETLKAKKSGCFIATAAYGTTDCTDVRTLQTFRDDVLLKSKLGTRFVQVYYLVSPTLASTISASSTLRYLIRSLLLRPAGMCCRLFLGHRFNASGCVNRNETNIFTI